MTQNLLILCENNVTAWQKTERNITAAGESIFTSRTRDGGSSATALTW
ncbi:hypothetical protein ACFOGG_15140 [Brenneria rubrifaciens]